MPRVYSDDIREVIEKHLKLALEEFVQLEDYAGCHAVITFLEDLNAFTIEPASTTGGFENAPLQVVF